MKVLFAITKSNWGGAQAYVYALATRFRDDGADVAVALGGTGTAGSESGLLAERLARAQVRTLRLASIARDLSVLQEVRALAELVRVIRTERPDVLHLNSSKAGALGALAGRIAGIPRTIFTAHGWPHREPVGPIGRIIRWLGSWATILLAHRVIVVSACDYRTAPVLFSKRKLVMVPNGIAPFPTLPRMAARMELISRAPSLRENVPWLLMIAELHPNKGIDTAISALARLTDYPDVALVVLGEGEERAALTALARSSGVADRVFLLGFVPDARSYLAAGDLFLMPSRKEGFPMALLEAGAAGLPAIASRVGGIPEIIEDRKSGILIHADDPIVLASSCRALFENPEQAASLAETLKQSVGDRFSETHMATATFATYL